MAEVDRNAAALTFEHDADDGVACGGGPCTAVAIVNKSKRWACSCHFSDVRYGTGEPRRLLPRVSGAAPPTVSSS